MPAGGRQLMEEAPAGRAPGAPGRLVGPGGDALHGTWWLPTGDGRAMVLVVNNGHLLLGWTVPVHHWISASSLVWLGRPLSLATPAAQRMS